jgi:AbiV family abortive infection protein
MLLLVLTFKKQYFRLISISFIILEKFIWIENMPKRKLNQYKGKLTPSQIAAGMNAAITTARELANAAKILLESNNFPPAASLAILSIEEAGKVAILRSLAVARSEDDVAQCWRDYRSHTKKNVCWLLPQLVASGAKKLDDFKCLFNEDAEHPFLLDQIKQIGFYTDCLGNAHWSQPAVVIDKKLATLLVSIANLFTRAKETSEIEIKLWVKHIGPVWKGPKEKMENALVQWQKEMSEKGLSEISEKEMENFILHGVGFSNNEDKE